MRVSVKEGISCFHCGGMRSIEWSYRKHYVVVIIQDEYNTEKDMKNTIKIFFNGRNVTEAYLDRTDDAPERIRTTLSNLAKVVRLIDATMDEIEAKEEEGDK